MSKLLVQSNFGLRLDFSHNAKVVKTYSNLIFKETLASHTFLAKDDNIRYLMMLSVSLYADPTLTIFESLPSVTRFM